MESGTGPECCWFSRGGGSGAGGQTRSRSLTQMINSQQRRAPDWPKKKEKTTEMLNRQTCLWNLTGKRPAAAVTWGDQKTWAQVQQRS